MSEHTRVSAEVARHSGRPSPVQETGSPGRTSFVVSGYAEARQALQEPALSKDTNAFFAGTSSTRDVHPVISRSMLATDAPEHGRLRRLVAGAFSTGTVLGLRPWIEQLTDQLLDQMDVSAPVDLVQALAVPLPVAVISELLAVPASDRPQLGTLSARLFAAGRPVDADAASHELARYMNDLVNDRRAHPGEDLVSRLIAARDGNGEQLSQFELTSLAALLLVAGHETTTHAIGNAVLELLRAPATLAHLAGNPDAIAPAIDELLRLASPVAVSTFRWSTAPVSLSGQEIPAGRPVLVALGQANRDAATFPDPDRLDLERGNASAQIAFGHGIHRCLGAPLAKAELEIVLRALLTRFPQLKLAVEPDQLQWQATRLVRGLVALPVQL
ncbi:cytochrome P450 [Streptacidiphilus sp. BW17]|uniref:cytochrome P450 family protein n=1 Tax=Streptacidiphilus sp. BW17 TaxID=3156274 RepID=UPI003512A24F